MEVREALESAYTEAAGGEGADTGGGNEVVPVPDSSVGTGNQSASSSGNQAEPAGTTAEPPESGADSASAPGKSLPAKDPATGKFLKAQTSGTKPPDKPVVGGKGATPVPAAGVQTATKPPQSWKPAERDAWAKVPTEAQAAIARRESEFARAMQESAPVRQVGQQFQSMMQPYEGLIRSMGGSPMHTVENLVQTMYALHTGPPGHKAQIAANIISQYGIDPAHVAQALQGQMPQGGNQQPNPQAFAQQLRQAGFLTREDIETQQRTALASHYDSKWNEFSSSHEFAEDLRESMAKLIESGLAKDFDDAYAKASSMDADISAAMRQRQEAKLANATRASMQKSRAASSSLKSNPAGGINSSQPKDLRSILDAAYDTAAGTRR